MTKSRHIEPARCFAPPPEKLQLYSMPEPNSGCQLWLRQVDRKGYGCVSVGGNRSLLAHRVAYELIHGAIPAGVFVCHKCDVPSCINVDHLFLGTPKDNMVDMVRKGRGKHEVHPGSRNGNAKITEAIAREIFAADGTQRDIAKRFSVSPATVSMIKNGHYWGHATREAA